MSTASDESVSSSTATAIAHLSSTGRLLILITAFLGWMFAGLHMSITSVAMRSAATDLLDRSKALDREEFKTLANADAKAKRNAATPSLALSLANQDQLKIWEERVARWFAWYQCSFLFGAASGGLFFGWLGDRIGRSKGMALSIIAYSSMAGAAYFAQRPEELLLFWFLACMGVGGMWPNGVALVSEAWASLSRPMAAGLIGTAANIGIFSMATLMASKDPQWAVTSENWRWVMLVAAAPLVLGLFSLIAVPESPRWLATRDTSTANESAAPQRGEIFRPPLLKITILGIALSTIPIFGGWGSANWMIPWAGKVGEAADPPKPQLKAQVNQARAATGIVGSLLGGWIASVVGRRRTYFLTSLIALAIAQYSFWRLTPTDPWFLVWVSALGFFSGIYFGWMPLFLPELFPTRNRSTGAGVSFNFGRILTAITVFATGTLTQLFEGDYARMGRVTSLIFALGAIVICFAPDTSQKQLAD